MATQSLAPALRWRLDRLRDNPTTYEVVVIRPDGRRRLLAYTRRAKHLLRRAAARRARDVAIFVCVRDVVLTNVPKQDAVRIIGGGEVRFSGRTERAAIMEGELPDVRDAP